jgi:L-ascorbate metabolism protein UlaG (beta-lactamase superfamily)
MKPDVILCTHNHLDHADPDTLKHFLTEEGSVIVLAPWEAWKTAEKFGGRLNNYVVFNRHTQFTLTGTDPREKIRFTAVKAEHSDATAVGAVIEADQKRIYITGDTLYNSEIFADLEELDGPIDMLFLPVNGVGNNMNMEDARRFCERVKPGVAVPFHCGMFDEIDLHDFAYEPKLVPQVYQEVKFPG